MGRVPRATKFASVASKVELGFRFDINNLKYPDIHVHVAYNSYLRLWPPRSWWPPNCFNGLKGEICLQIWNYWPQIPWHPCACWLKQLFTVMASEAKATSKWPQRPLPIIALENYIIFIFNLNFQYVHKTSERKEFELPEVGLEPGTSWFKVQHPNHYTTGLEAILNLKFWGSTD